MKEIIVIIAILGGALAHHKVHLIPAHVICPGVHGEQDILIPSPLDCAVYYRCRNGMAIPENCPPGLNWCQVLNQCTLPVLANCTIGHNPVTYGPGETIPIQTTPPPGEENVCPINGAILPNPSDCHSYFECDGEAIVSQKCPDNEAYSCWDQQCESAEKANCLDGNSQTGKNCSEEEVKLPNTKDCSSYYQCVNGQVVLKQCEEKEGFSAWYEKCVPMNETNCGQFVNSTGPPPSTTVSPETDENICPHDGATLPDVSDCTKYYRCVNQEPVSESCPDNEAYSCWVQKCVNAKDADCLNNNPNQTGASCASNGITMPNTKDCGSYYKCDNGKVVLEKCEEDEGFNAWFGRCVPRNESHCGSTGPDTNSTVSPATASNPGSTGSASNEPPTGPTVTNPTNPGSTGSASNEPPTGPTVTNPTNPGSTGSASNEPPTGPTETNPTNPGSNETASNEPPTRPTETNPTNPGSTGSGSNETSTGPTVTNPTNPGSTGSASNEPPTGPTVTNSTNPGSSGTGSNEPPTGPTVTNPSNPGSNVTTPTGISTEPPATNTGTTSKIETTTNSNGSHVSPQTEEDVCPTDGAKIPNPVNCTSYYVCRNGTPEAEDCPNGQEYSCWDQKCKDPVDATCINEGNQQGNNCSNENESLPNLENCNSYYQCQNKTIQLKYCPINTQYNKWFHRCYDYALAWCETDPVVPPTSTILPPMATIPPSSTENVCPNDGARLPNIFDCTSYYVCKDNEPVPVQCPVGQAYSCWSQKCLPAKEANCISQTNPGGICSITGLQLPNIKNCNSYYECDDGKIKEKHCHKGLLYNSWYGKCVDKKLSHCTVETSTGSPPKTESPVTPPATDSCRKNGQLLADPSDCTKYYICVNGKGVSKDCPKGKNFNSWTLKCDKSDSQNDTCITDIKPDQNCSVSDESIPNVWDCGSYYICVKGKVQMKLCASGTFYNKWFKMCVSFNLAFCFALNPPTMPTLPSIPPIGGPDICPVDGALIPNPVDCSAYYECINFTPQLQFCPPGLGYSCWDQKCENSTDAACILTVSSGRKCSQNHVKVQDVTDCSSYYECVDGTVKKQRCPLGLQFNNRWKICVISIVSRCQTYSTVTPTPSPVTVSTPNIVTDVCPNNNVQLPNPTNCSTYYKCLNGNPVLHECADGLQYSCWDFKCTTPEEANCISEGSQSGMPCSYNGEKSQDPQDCHSYYECVSGIVVQKKCQWNWYYNKWFGCVPLAALAHCNKPNKPVTITPPPIPSTTVAPSLSNDLCPTDGATLPNPASCNRYYECHNQTAVDKTCPTGLVYSCWDQKCLPKKEGKCITAGISAGDSCSREGEKLQDVNNCNTYYECRNGKVQKQFCFPLFRYNKWYKKCVLPPYDHCETYSTTQKPAEVTTAPTIHSAACAKDNSTIPNPKDCHSYYVCSHNTGTLHYCPEGYNYDCWNEKCNLALFSRCVNAPTVFEGQSCSKKDQTIPDVTDCKKYYKCSKGIIVHLSCSFLYSYSIWAEKCVLSVVAVCANSKIFGIF